MTQDRYHLPIAFGWYGIAFSGDIAHGEVQNLQYVGQQLVLFRTESGQAHVVEPFCPHLGAHIGIGGSVDGEHITCPFHAWQFDGDGLCQHIPYANPLPADMPEQSKLYAYPCVEKNGVIWIWYHPLRQAPSFDVVEVEELNSDQWTDYEHFEWTINSSLQETAENAADAAHFQFVHGVKDVPTGTVEHIGHRRNGKFESISPHMDDQGNIDETGTRWCTTYLDTSNNGPGQTWQRFKGIFDVVMLGIVTPIDAHNIHMRFAFKRHRQMNEAENFITECFIQEVNRQVSEDIPIWEHKRYNPKPALCDGDGPISQFRKWYRQFYIESEIIASDLSPDA